MDACNIYLLTSDSGAVGGDNEGQWEGFGRAIRHNE